MSLTCKGVRIVLDFGQKRYGIDMNRALLNCIDLGVGEYTGHLC